MNLKYIFTRIIYKARYKLKHQLPLNKITAVTTKPKIYLLGSVEYMNYGDHAINIAENNLLKEGGMDYITIPESLIDVALPVIKKHIKADDVIFCQGGGNMGDVWPEQERWRQEIFATFPKNKIIVFPQSVNFKPGSTLLKRTIELASKHENLTFLMRDQASFEFVKQHFPANVKVRLVPDMVMILNKTNPKIKRTEVVTTFLRRDVEKLTDPRIEALLARVQEKYPLAMRDTVSDYWYYVDDRNREAFLDHKLREFQTSKFIITDRLHGMIFAAITKTPAIVFDNNNHKIFNLYHTWLENCQYLQFINHEMDDAQITAAVEQLLNNQDYTFDQDRFKKLINAAINEDV